MIYECVKSLSVLDSNGLLENEPRIDIKVGSRWKVADKDFDFRMPDDLAFVDLINMEDKTEIKIDWITQSRYFREVKEK